MRWTVPVPMPSDFATFKIPTPFASCFRSMRISRRSRNNKNDTHVAINGATSESGKRHEPVAQVRRSGDCLRLHHSNHRIDVCGFEPELLFAVDLSLCKLR